MERQRKYNKEIVPISRVLRRNMTKEEKHLWYDFLKDYPYNFARQKVLGKYIADFYCAKAQLVIELDGSGHYTDNGKREDAERTAYLESMGIMVIRFKNSWIWDGFRSVCNEIDETVKKRVEELSKL